MIWDLAPRSPVQIARDVGRAAREPRTLARGILSFAIGLLLLAGSVSVLLPLLLPEHALVALATWTAVAALLVHYVAATHQQRR